MAWVGRTEEWGDTLTLIFDYLMQFVASLIQAISIQLKVKYKNVRVVSIHGVQLPNIGGNNGFLQCRKLSTGKAEWCLILGDFNALETGWNITQATAGTFGQLLLDRVKDATLAQHPPNLKIAEYPNNGIVESSFQQFYLPWRQQKGRWHTREKRPRN